MAQDNWPSPCTSLTYSARPWALSPIVRSLIALEPIGYILPRRPPVPNGIVVQKTSSSSFQRASARCSATSGAYLTYRGSVSQARILFAAVGLSSFASAAELSCSKAVAASKDCKGRAIVQAYGMHWSFELEQPPLWPIYARRQGRRARRIVFPPTRRASEGSSGINTTAPRPPRRRDQEKV